MNRPITISLSPNTEPDDISSAWHVLLHPRIWKQEDFLKNTEQKLKNIFHGHQVALTSSGRNALASILEALEIGSGDEVLVQAFTCIAVPAPVQWVGAKPIYVDIDPQTYNFDPEDLLKKITSKTKALIVQHTFGIPADIERIKAIAEQHKLILIEDCAHALGATYNNQLLGTFGDVAFLSFGRDKCISTVFGGAVVSKNPELINKIKAFQQKLPLPSSRWILQQLFHPIAFNSIVPVYFSGFGKALLIVLQHLGLLSKAVEVRERTGEKPSHFGYRYSPALAYLLNKQLDKLDRYTARRREIVQKYVTAFNSQLPAESLLRFPITVKDPKKFLLAAREKNMLLGDWYDAPLVPATSSLSSFSYAVGMCPKAEEAAEHVINLPTYPLLTDEQIDKVIQFVKESL